MSLFLSGLRKLVRRPATWVTLGLLAGLLVLIVIAVTATVNRAGPSAAERLSLITFPAAYDAILTFILGLGGLFAVIYGAAIAGSEWQWGTLKNAVARGQSRSRYVLLTFASVAVAIAVGLVVTFLVGVVAALLGATVAGVSTSGLTDSTTVVGCPSSLSVAGSRSPRKGRLDLRSLRSPAASSPELAPASRSTSGKPSPGSSCPISSSTCPSASRLRQWRRAILVAGLVVAEAQQAPPLMPTPLSYLSLFGSLALSWWRRFSQSAPKSPAKSKQQTKGHR